jgi:hypothetical protein
MKFLFILVSLFLIETVSEKNIRQTDVNSSWNDSLEVKPTVFFNTFSFLFPPSYISETDVTSGSAFDILYFDSPDSTVWIKIRKEKTKSSLEVCKSTCEFMAPRFYKGEIHKSEYITVNNHTVYYFEMSGYWNKSKVKESWMRFYTIQNGYLYWGMFKFPEKQLNTSVKLREKIVQSIQFI